MRDRVLWAMTLVDAEEAINKRQKQQIQYIQKAVEPISKLTPDNVAQRVLCTTGFYNVRVTDGLKAPASV